MFLNANERSWICRSYTVSKGITEMQRQERSHLGETVSEGIKSWGAPQTRSILLHCVSPLDVERRSIGDSRNNRQRVVLNSALAYVHMAGA